VQRVNDTKKSYSGVLESKNVSIFYYRKPSFIEPWFKSEFVGLYLGCKTSLKPDLFFRLYTFCFLTFKSTFTFLANKQPIIRPPKFLKRWFKAGFNKRGLTVCFSPKVFGVSMLSKWSSLAPLSLVRLDLRQNNLSNLFIFAFLIIYKRRRSEF
jgi:hypothetical protein